MMKASQLEIRLLGPVVISFNGESLKISRRTERGILCYLAVENRPFSRTALIDLLWPQAEQVDPRGSLRTALSRLRTSLPDKNLLLTEHDQVVLDVTRCQIDLLQFEDSYQSLQSILSAFRKHEPLPDQIVKQISDSLNLWQGDRIFQGEDFSDYPVLADWHQSVNMKLSQHREILMRRLADHYQASGQLEQAMDLFTHLGRLNIMDQSAHLAVIDILIKLGRHQEAQEFCDALEVIYEREHNAPLPDEVIQRCRFSQQLLEESANRPGQAWPIPLSVQLPLVGREAELAQLRAAFYRGGVVKIEGMMGVGKTRLVQELFETLSPKPLLFLAPARESESTLPLAPIIYGLRRFIPDEIWQTIDGVWANHLSLLLPELTEIRKDCGPSMVGKLNSASQHLFDALHHVFGLVAKRYGRVLFFLDDAEWADRQTVAALSYLVMQGFFEEYGVLIVATHIREHNIDIEMMFDQQRRVGYVEVITLNPLNPEAIKNLVYVMLKEPPSSSFLNVLYHQTKGNPFWTLEFVRHLLDVYGDIQALQNVKKLPLIERAQSFILYRLSRFKEESRYLVACAAVISDNIPITLLRSVSEMSQQDFLIALEPLIQFEFLHLRPAGDTPEGRLTFPHELVREVVLRETNAVHRQMLHQRVAVELSNASDSMAMAAIIAEHFKEAGDVEKGFEWHLKAAGHAWVIGAAKDVIWSFQMAEEILKNTPGDVFGVNDIFQLYYQWGQFAYQSNQVSFLQEVGVKLQQFFEKDPGCLLVGLSNLTLAMACFLWQDFETGLLLIQKAVKNLERTHHTDVLIQAYYLQSLFEWWTLQFDEVFTTANRITKLVEGSELDPSLQTASQFLARRIVCDIYIALGEARIALEMAQELFQEFFEKLDTLNQWRAHNLLAHANYISGHYKMSEEYAHKGLKIAQVLDNAVVEVIALIILCKAEIMCGHLDEAFQLADRALTLAEGHHIVQSIVTANTLMGDIYDILHNTSQAMQYYRIAQVRQGYTFQSIFGLENNIHLARLLARSGQIADARELLQTILSVSEQKGLMSSHVEALLVDGLIDLEEGMLPSADHKFSSAVVIAEQKGLIQDVMWGKFRMAQMGLFQEQYDHAEELLIEVLEFTRSEKMILLNKLALELASQLSRHKALWTPIEKLQSEYQALVAKLEAHTQSEPLRQDFLNAQGLWREK